MSGVTHVLNNTESVLQKEDVKDAIDGYEALFAGARKEVRRESCLHRCRSSSKQRFCNSMVL